MKKISVENQNLSQFVGKVFGEGWSVAEHLDEQRQPVVYVVSGTDSADNSIVSHATIGLSDHKLGEDQNGVALGAELVAAVRQPCDYLDRALAGAANFIMKSNLLCKPGTIFANVLEGYDVSSQMNHFLFAVPSMWENRLYPLQFKAKTVLWLQALPISDAEKEFGEKHGPDALGEKLQEAGVDLTDMQRQSAV